jgi:hypothetical protein
MLQIWFMLRDIPPDLAARNGADAAVCGDCALRTVIRRWRTRTGQWKETQERPCYVKLFKPVTNIWRAYRAGKYPPLVSDAQWKRIVALLPARFGAYGDPAALPLPVLQALADPALQLAGLTGYTHLWKTHPALRQWFMASVETEANYLSAKTFGWRTFRTLALDDNGPLHRREILCPYPRTNCRDCQLCNGLVSATDRRADIAIRAHGAGASLLTRLTTENTTNRLTPPNSQQ